MTLDSRNLSRQADYGIDAPYVIRNLIVAGIASIAAGVGLGAALDSAQPDFANFLFNWGLWAGVTCLVVGVAMIWSSKFGKLRERDRLLDALRLRGDERVLDVGCGRGLLLVGAAKRLATGQAVGVDIWQTEDQSGNDPKVTAANARAEGVGERIDVENGDARSLPFPDASFDVVVSSLALHNIPTAEGRERAVREIARVLRPGGRVAFDDIFRTANYAQTLEAAGFVDVARSGLRFSIVPPVRTVTGRKPEPGEEET